MNQIEELIKESAERADQSALVDIVTQATEHPESAAAAHLDVESLRIRGQKFLSSTKGAIGALYSERPQIDGDAAPRLAHYEEEVTDYLRVHNQTRDQLIGTSIEDPLELRRASLESLHALIANWDNNNKAFILGCMAGIGSRSTSPSELRHHLANAAGDVTETLWSVVQIGRDVRADLTEESPNLDTIEAAYLADTDEQFGIANQLVTTALSDLVQDGPMKEET